ncbi:MAG: outer membrane lipoprotein carrier protein LolA [Muribaculaceae bacterium]
MKIKAIYNKVAALVVAVCLAFAAYAAEPAKTTVTKCSAALKAAPSLTATFLLDSDNGQIPGSLTMSGRCFKLITDRLSIWYDGKTQWTYVPENEEVNITEPTADELLETNPVEIINASMSKYSARVVRTEGSVRTIELKPLKPGSSIVSAELSIDTARNLPTRVVAVFTNGSRLIANIANVKIGKAIPRSAFVYDTKLHPSAETVDLR